MKLPASTYGITKSCLRYVLQIDKVIGHSVMICYYGFYPKRMIHHYVIHPTICFLVKSKKNAYVGKKFINLPCWSVSHDIGYCLMTLVTEISARFTHPCKNTNVINRHQNSTVSETFSRNLRYKPDYRCFVIFQTWDSKLG